MESIIEFPCNLCSAHFLSEVHLQIHLKFHYNTFSCSICKETFNKNATLQNHILSIHCNNNLITIKRIKSPHKKPKLSSDLGYPCYYCGEKFPLRRSLHLHMIGHISKKAVSCNGCDETFEDETSLKQHIKAVHMKQYSCEICNKIFYLENALEVHIQTHQLQEMQDIIEGSTKNTRHEIDNEAILGSADAEKSKDHSSDQNESQSIHKQSLSNATDEPEESTFNASDHKTLTITKQSPISTDQQKSNTETQISPIRSSEGQELTAVVNQSSMCIHCQKPNSLANRFSRSDNRLEFHTTNKQPSAIEEQEPEIFHSSNRSSYGQEVDSMANQSSPINIQESNKMQSSPKSTNRVEANVEMVKSSLKFIDVHKANNTIQSSVRTIDRARSNAKMVKSSPKSIEVHKSIEEPVNSPSKFNGVVEAIVENIQYSPCNDEENGTKCEEVSFESSQESVIEKDQSSIIITNVQANQSLSTSKNIEDFNSDINHPSSIAIDEQECDIEVKQSSPVSSIEHKPISEESTLRHLRNTPQRSNKLAMERNCKKTHEAKDKKCQKNISHLKKKQKKHFRQIKSRTNSVVKHKRRKYHYSSKISRKYLDKLENFKEHFEKIKHEEDEFCCPICNKILTTKYSLAEHLRRHSDDRPWKCSKCSKPFKEQYSLQRHLIIHSTDRPYTCNVCKKTFNMKSTFKKHKLIHTERKKTFKCKICKKAFSENGILKQHMITHSNERPFSCPECGKGFKFMSTLRRHKVIHSSDRPFSCDVCDKTFNLKNALRVHKERHIHAEPMFSCSKCDKSFTTKGYLKIHLLVHTDNPFMCKKCNITFKSMYAFSRHRKMHRQIKTE